MCMWQRHSTSSRPRATWKNMEELAASEATLNIKYWLHFLPRPLSTMFFTTALFARAITCVGRHIDNNPSGSAPHSSAGNNFKLTPQMRTSSELSQEESTQNGCLCVHIARARYFRTVIYTIFRKFNFRCRLDQPIFKHQIYRTILCTKMLSDDASYPYAPWM